MDQISAFKKLNDNLTNMNTSLKGSIKKKLKKSMKKFKWLMLSRIKKLMR